VNVLTLSVIAGPWAEGGAAHGLMCGQGLMEDDGHRGWYHVHRLVLSISLQNGACVAHGLVQGQGAVVGASPESGGLQIGSSSALRGEPRPSSVPPTASYGAREDQMKTAHVVVV